MIITVTPNPAIDKSIVVDDFKIDSVNRALRVRYDAGGKGLNVSKVVAALGGDTIALGIIGGSTGEFIEKEMTRRGISNKFVWTDCQTRTNLKIFDSKLKTYTDINEAGEDIGSEVFGKLVDSIYQTANTNDIVVLAGRGTADIANSEYAKIVKQLALKSVKTIVDMDGERLKLALDASPYAIKPNEFEFQEIYGLADVKVQTLANKARELASERVPLVVVSMGSRGAIFASKGECLVASAPKIEAVSTVGAGDSVTAAMAFAIENNYKLPELARIAIATGSAKVTKEGSSPPTIEEINQFKEKIKVINV